MSAAPLALANIRRDTMHVVIKFCRKTPLDR
jgi:hypothetical protein